MNEHIHDQLSQYLDDELAAPDRAKFEAHVASCAECRREVEQLKALDQLVKSKDAPPKLAADYWDWHRQHTWKRIRAERRQPQLEPFRPRFIWFRLAAVAGGVAIVLVVVVAGWKMMLPGAARHSEPRVALEEKVEEPAAGGEAKRDAVVPEAPAGGYAMSTKPAASIADADREKVQTAVGSTRAAQGKAVETGAGAAGAKIGSGLALGKEKEPVAEVAPRTPAPEASVSSIERLAAGDVDALTACDQMPRVVDIPRLPTVEAAETSTVLLRALVELTGRASRVEVDRSSGNTLLDSIALNNVQQAKFQPAMEAGRNVRCWLKLAQRFESESGRAEEIRPQPVPAPQQPQPAPKSDKPEQQDGSDSGKSDEPAPADKSGDK